MARRKAPATAAVTAEPSERRQAIDLTVDTEKLALLLALAECAIGDSPVTKCAYLYVSDDALTVKTVNAQLRIESSMKIDKVSGTASFLVDFDRFSTAITACGKEPGRLRWNKDSGKLLITSSGKRFDLSTLHSYDFPPPPESQGAKACIEIKASDLAWSINATSYAVPRSKERMHLQKINVIMDATSIKALGTNGQIASVATIQTESDLKEQSVVHIGLNGFPLLSQLLRGDATVTITECESYITIVTGFATVWIASTEGAPPTHVGDLGTHDPVASAIVDRKTLASAIRTISKLSDAQELRPLFLEFTAKGLAVSNKGYEEFAARELVPVISVGKVGRHICINRKWLLDACVWTGGSMLIEMAKNDLGPYLMLKTVVADSSETRSAVTYLMSIADDSGYQPQSQFEESEAEPSAEDVA